VGNNGIKKRRIFVDESKEFWIINGNGPTFLSKEEVLEKYGKNILDSDWEYQRNTLGLNKIEDKWRNREIIYWREMNSHYLELAE